MFNIGIRKVGGIWFWNVGRIGGSFHVSSKSAFTHKQYVNACKVTERNMVRIERIKL